MSPKTDTILSAWEAFFVAHALSVQRIERAITAKAAAISTGDPTISAKISRSNLVGQARLMGSLDRIHLDLCAIF